MCKTYEDKLSGKDFNRKEYKQMKLDILEYKAEKERAEMEASFLKKLEEIERRRG